MKRKNVSIFIIVVTALLVVVSILTNRNISNTSLEELGASLGIITLIPTILSVVLAFISQNVIFSLLIGILSGVLILALVNTNSITLLPYDLFEQGLLAIKNVIFDIDNIEILLLCFVVGGMIEVAKSLRGFDVLANRLTLKVNTPRKANLLSSILGLFVMFDDYANTLIVGQIMKPITDRVKVSRQKLSFIVDSTAAPVSAIAIISSWIGVEVASIEKGLEIVNSNINGFLLFLKSIPYCFYCIFAISFLFVLSIIGKDFGPMLEAERDASKLETNFKQDCTSSNNKTDTKRMLISIGSIVIMISFAIISFYVNGKNNAIKNAVLLADCKFTLANLTKAISYAETVNLISSAAIIGSIFAIVLGCINSFTTFKESIKSWIYGAKKMSSTVLLLSLAWTLAEVVNRLGTTYFVVETISKNVNPILVPILIFLSCCLISCASGSFGCMFVVMPLAIPLAFKMNSLGTMISDEMYLLICVGSVIAGSIFGDHCSPITDCTILAAIGSGCETMEHCYTQLPYTLVNCLISTVCGILLTSLGINVALALLLGVLIQVLIVLIIGKRPI